MGFLTRNSVEGAEQNAEAAALTAAARIGDVGTGAIGMLDKVHINEVKPCILCGACCALASVGIHWPYCIGCGQAGTLCACIEYESSTCKPLKGHPSIRCLCQTSSCVFVSAGKTLCQHQSQCCCLEGRCGLPCNSEHPCICTVLGLQFFREERCACPPKMQVKFAERIAAVTITPSVPSITRV